MTKFVTSTKLVLTSWNWHSLLVSVWIVAIVRFVVNSNTFENIYKWVGHYSIVQNHFLSAQATPVPVSISVYTSICWTIMV